MKAMVLKGPGELLQEEIEVPAPNREREALIRVTHTGICGTDYKIYQGAIGVRYPLVMGHEIVGKVADSGDSTGLSIGDRVIVDPSLFCGTCFDCRRGRKHLCGNGGLLGRDRNGGFAEFIAVPATNIFRLPPQIDDRTAAVVQVLTTCLHSQRLSVVLPEQSVVVLGLGVTGQLQAQLVKKRGAHPVIGISRSGFKRALARRCGLDFAIEAGPDAIKEVLELTNGQGADLVIETTGNSSVLQNAFEMVSHGGRLLLFGINSAEATRLPLYQLYHKELTILGSRAAKHEDFETAIELVTNDVVELAPLITHTISFPEIPVGIQMNGSDREERLKIVVQH